MLHEKQANPSLSLCNQYSHVLHLLIWELSTRNSRTDISYLMLTLFINLNNLIYTEHINTPKSRDLLAQPCLFFMCNFVKFQLTIK